jgi:hypothetical protein
MQRQPAVFLIVFQLGLRDLDVGILLLPLRSIAPLSQDSKIVEFLSVAFVENQNAKRHKFTEKSILQHSIFPFPTQFPTAVFQEQNQTSRSFVEE